MLSTYEDLVPYAHLLNLGRGTLATSDLCNELTTPEQDCSDCKFAISDKYCGLGIGNPDINTATIKAQFKLTHPELFI